MAAPLSTLTDTFGANSIDAVKWNAYYDGGTGSISEGGGFANFAPSPLAAPGYATFDSQSLYDLTSSYGLVRVAQTLNADANANTSMYLRVDDNNYFEMRVIGSPATINANKNVLGVGVTVASMTYSAVTHAWWRIRESAGSIFWDTSPDGSTWTNLGNFVNVLTITSMSVRLTGETSAVATPGTAKMANFNLGSTHALTTLGAGA